MKPKYMIIDTETTVKQQKAFNIAYQLTTEAGFQVEKKDFWIPEVLKEDKPFYSLGKPCTAVNTTKEEIKQTLQADEQKVDCVLAYNSPFDQRSLKLTLDFEFTKPVKDLWTAASVYICDDDYIKWARDNNKLTDKGNIKTSAETVYQYISRVDDFQELHTALQDTQCEKEIVKHLTARKIDLTKLENHPAPWRIVKKRAEEMDKENN